MHGVILSNFKHYLVEGYGSETWRELAASAGLSGKTFVPVAMYPDHELEALLEAAEQATGLRRDDILEDFGEWVIGPLIGMYRAMIPADWNVVDFLLNMEQRIHQRIVRMKNPDAEPPHIQVTELRPRVVQINYRSARNMSAMALGCVRGVAQFFNEQVDVLEDQYGEDGERCFVVALSPQQVQVAS